MTALLLTAALCVSLCTGFASDAQEPDAGVSQQEQTGSVTEEGIPGKEIPEEGT